MTGSVLMRGITNDGLETTPNFKLVEGRMFAPGKHELIVGAVISDEYLDLRIDDELSVRGVDWHIVGRFSTAGNAVESELLGDLITVMSAYERTAYSSIRVQLIDAEGITQFVEFVEADPRLKLDAMWESEYFKAGPASAIIRFVAYVVSGIMAVGAVFGALNVMYSTVADRATEIATLRALGFLPGQVAVSVVIESMLLALVGAVVGVLIFALAFHGSTFTSGSLTSLTTALEVTPVIAALCIAAGCAIGFVGGVVPAIGAARRSIVDGLRSQS
ncbi:MAG: hypothetical protein O7F71_18055 [Gammaproteobacteria bacterium]|nr:hypothetical protein [Gammaproteobacteria bacterium]